MKTEVIIVAAGQGARLNAKLPKALVLLKGRPLVSYSLKVFENHPGIDGVVVVGAEGFLSDFVHMKCNLLLKVYKIKRNKVRFYLQSRH